MDKVRLGRAFGYGTRHAAKTLAAVAAAAAAPSPREAAVRQPAAQQPPVAPRETTVREARAGQPEPLRRTQAAPAPARTPARVRRAGRSLWEPLAVYSGALWLRVTGLFFAVIALLMAGGAWRLRERLSVAQPNVSGRQHFWTFVGLTALFGYFAVSSFVRANLRERR